MTLRLKTLAAGFLALTAIWTVTALTPPTASAKWAFCTFGIFTNYEFTVWQFCERTKYPGEGIADRWFFSPPEESPTVASSGTLNLNFTVAGLVGQMSCNVASSSKFFNEGEVGKGERTSFGLSGCSVSKPSQCPEAAVTTKSLPYATSQPIREEKFFVLTKGIKLEIALSGSKCPLKGSKFPFEGSLEGEWTNTPSEQLVFPATALPGTSLTAAGNAAAASGSETYERKEGETVEAV